MYVTMCPVKKGLKTLNSISKTEEGFYTSFSVIVITFLTKVSVVKKKQTAEHL